MSYVKGLRCRECGAEQPVSPLHVYFSREARPYGLLLMLASVAVM